MPNIVMNAVKRLILTVFIVFRFFLRILTCKYFRRPQRIGELPTYILSRESAGNEQFGGIYSPSMSPLAADSSWSNWSEKSNANSAISEQIKEYRRRRQEELLAERTAKKRGHPHGGGANVGNGSLNMEDKKDGEPDLFAEMQPKVKAPKKLLMRKNQQGFTNQRQNRFQMQDDVDEYLRSGAEIEEFGELKEISDNFGGNEGRERATSWLDEDDNVDLDELDEFEREQRRKEREERKMRRQIEHAQQFEEKRKKRQTEHRIQF